MIDFKLVFDALRQHRWHRQTGKEMGGKSKKRGNPDIFTWNFIEPLLVFYIVVKSSRSGADIEGEYSICNLLQKFSK